MNLTQNWIQITKKSPENKSNFRIYHQYIDVEEQKIVLKSQFSRFVLLLRKTNIYESKFVARLSDLKVKTYTAIIYNRFCQLYFIKTASKSYTS